ncbi:MAG: histidine kinase [Lachnospiraceae bacterium]|nr:histidine kinase [Lachnospiraceae bacterium]
MMKRFKQKFHNLKFQKKIITVSMVISLIPIVLLGLFAYTRMRSLLIEREETAIQETLHQEVMQLDYKLDSYLSTMNLITWNENIRLALSRKYDSNFEMYLTYRDTIDPLFLTIRSLNTDITAITIYTDTCIYPHGNTLRPLTDAQGQKWFEQACSTTSPFFSLSEDGQTICLICQMHYNYVPYTSIICMTIDFQSAMLPANNLFQNNYGFLLTDSSGGQMYQYTNLDERYSDSEISLDLLLNDEPSDYITKTETLSNFGWTAFLCRPAHSISAAAINITYVVLAMILLCIVLIFFISTLLSKIIVLPIEKLSSSMEQVEQGNYEIEIFSNSTDEIGQLICSFKKMVDTLNNLVNEVLLSKIRQQKYEIEILQSQINPHFLYNSLSLINSKAIIAGQNDISQMARLLSTFYRTMLNKGQQITTIASELENTKSYIAIQQMMHSQSFDVIYDIDNSILDYSIPNLLIQPLAENAIIHGLDHRELPGKAILSVSCYQENQDIFFKIMDNGCGMSEEECSQILTKSSNGYGVKNVHQRIQLYYGADYGLTFHSTKGMGTYVLVKINTSLNKE